MAFGATALALAEPAAANHVAVVVASPMQQPTRGAHGRLVAGVGTTVTRQRAIAALLRGRVHDSHLGDFHPEDPVISLARRPAHITIYVELPPEGTWPNAHRYDVTIVGGGYRFPRILTSKSTRIPGLVSIADIAPTARALERGEEPRIGWRETDDPDVELGNLESRLNRAEEVQTPATLALGLLMAAAFVLAVVTRSSLFARAALLVPPSAIAASILISALDPFRSAVVAPVLTVLSACFAFACAKLLRSDPALGRALVAFLGAYALVLALAPEVNAFAPIGPQPWSGGRFYGVTNLVETLLLPSALVAGALLPRAMLLPVALLTLVTIGGSETGADGGGIVVVSAGFAALALRLSEAPLTRRRVALATAVVLAAVFAFVGLDAAAGGSSHVVDAVGSGPDLLDDFTRRMRLSFEILAGGLGPVLALAASLPPLGYFAVRRPRYAAVDAFLVALAVSLLANDAPTRVIGFGALACGGLWAFERFGRTRVAE